MKTSDCSHRVSGSVCAVRPPASPPSSVAAIAQKSSRSEQRVDVIGSDNGLTGLLRRHAPSYQEQRARCRGHRLRAVGSPLPPPLSPGRNLEATCCVRLPSCLRRVRSLVDRPAGTDRAGVLRPSSTGVRRLVSRSRPVRGAGAAGVRRRARGRRRDASLPRARRDARCRLRHGLSHPTPERGDHRSRPVEPNARAGPRADSRGDIRPRGRPRAARSPTTASSGSSAATSTGTWRNGSGALSCRDASRRQRARDRRCIDGALGGRRTMGIANAQRRVRMDGLQAVVHARGPSRRARRRGDLDRGRVVPRRAIRRR